MSRDVSPGAVEAAALRDPPRVADVTIAIPVHNGSKYLAESIASARAQTVAATHVVVWDNASTDDTLAIARSLVPASDVHTADRNFGAAANFDRAVRAATTQWFMWLAADDRIDACFIEACMAAIGARSSPPDAVLTGIRYIDEHGDEIRTQIDEKLGSEDIATRARAYLRKSRWTEAYCLYRREALLRSPGMTPEFGTDVLLVWWFLLRNPLVVVDQLLFEYREETTPRSPEETARTIMVNESTPYWRKCRMFYRMWTMTRDPELSTPVARTARREMLSALLTTAAAQHLREDLRFRADSLAHKPSSLRRRLALDLLRLGVTATELRAKISLNGGDGGSSR